MVFPGRFSTGCLRCRQRKVKCDEAKPTCKRCYTYGKPCPGYTDQFHFRHTRAKVNDKTSSASTTPPTTSTTRPVTQARGQQQQRQQQQQLQLQQQRQGSPQSAQSLPPDALALIRAPDPSHDDLSLCYFVRRFASPDRGDGFPGHFSFLPGLYDHYQSGLLETATLSVSQLAAYNQFGKEELLTHSLKNYGAVIKGLQEIINSGEQAVDDRVVATILLLCTWKDISGEGLGDPNEHASGLFYLLEKRGPEQIGTRRGSELFLLALLRLQVYSFLHENETYSDPGAIATLMGIFDPLFRALSMMSHTLSLRHRLFKFINSNRPLQQMPTPASLTEDTNELEEEQLLVQECFEMLDKFYIWDQEAAGYWQSTFEGRGVPTGLGEMSSGNTHYDPETACIIVLVRSARLILLLTMLLYHNQLPSTDDIHGESYNALWAQCVPALQSDVSKTIEDMLASVPYALGDIDVGGKPATMTHDGAAAITIVHSIRLISHCAYATPAQIERAELILKRMNAAIGIRSAVGWSEAGGYRLGFDRARSISSQPTPSPILSQYEVAPSVEPNFGETPLDYPPAGDFMLFS